MPQHQFWYSVITISLFQHSAISAEIKEKTRVVWVQSRQCVFKRVIYARLSALEHKSMHILRETCRSDSLHGVSSQPDKHNDSGSAIKHNYLIQDYDVVMLF